MHLFALLTRLSRLLRILRLHAHDLNLVPSITVYMRWGKGPRQRLRFTKTGDPRIEEAYHDTSSGEGAIPPSRAAGFPPMSARPVGREKLHVAWNGLSPSRAVVQCSRC